MYQRVSKQTKQDSKKRQDSKGSRLSRLFKTTPGTNVHSISSSTSSQQHITSVQPSPSDHNASLNRQSFNEPKYHNEEVYITEEHFSSKKSSPRDHHDLKDDIIEEENIFNETRNSSSSSSHGGFPAQKSIQRIDIQPQSPYVPQLNAVDVIRNSFDQNSSRRTSNYSGIAPQSSFVPPAPSFNDVEMRNNLDKSSSRRTSNLSGIQSHRSLQHSELNPQHSFIPPPPPPPPPSFPPPPLVSSVLNELPPPPSPTGFSVNDNTSESAILYANQPTSKGRHSSVISVVRSSFDANASIRHEPPVYEAPEHKYDKYESTGENDNVQEVVYVGNNSNENDLSPKQTNLLY